MPDNGGTEPCPSCDAKIILNGDIAAVNLNSTCESIERFLDRGGKFSNKDLHKLVNQANLIEDEVDKFRRMVLEAQGFAGPWPHSLS